MIYRYLPRSAGLRRITLHKSQLTGDKLYLLIVECTNFLPNFSAAAALIPALRARLCGYTGIYRSVATFWNHVVALLVWNLLSSVHGMHSLMICFADSLFCWAASFEENWETKAMRIHFFTYNKNHTIDKFIGNNK